MHSIARFFLAGAVLAAGAPLPQAIPLARAQAAPVLPEATYADLADLADSAPLVVHARVRKLAAVEDGRAPALPAGQGRFYIEADTIALLTGATPLGRSFAYLVNLPVDARGKPLLRKKDEVILFARPVAGRQAELQLVRPNAQVTSNPATQARVRAVLTALLAPDAPARITGVRELIYVPGNLAGEGETQIFLKTRDASAASITVRHVPGQPPAWGVSFSELTADVGHPPEPDTLEWYRLACFLPAAPPQGANMSEAIEDRRTAAADYRLVVSSLGPCRRAM